MAGCPTSMSAERALQLIQFHANHLEFELLCGGGDACFAGKCQSANDITALGLNLIGVL